MKKICFIINGLGRGGAETQVLRLSRAFEQTHEVHIISLIPLCEFDLKTLKSTRVHFFNLSPKRIVGEVAKMHSLLRTLRPDVLIAFMFHAIVVGRTLAALLRIPLVSSVRTDRNSNLRKTLIKKYLPMDRAVVFNSQASADKFWEGTPALRTLVIPNAIAPEFFEPARSGPAEPLIQVPHFKWVAVGRFEEAKDYPNLLSAFARLQSGSHLYIVGKGTLMEAATQQIQDLGLQDRVHLLGMQDNVSALLKQADAYVLSSAWEGMPNALMEAMASGLACVTTQVGGVKEIITSREMGLVVEPRNSEALAEALAQVESLSPEKRKAMGELGRSAVASVYSIEAVSQQWLQLAFESRSHTSAQLS